MMKYSLLGNQSLTSILTRNFSIFRCVSARKPPIEEYENNQFHTRKKTADPFDRRWRWTAKSAEPYNVNGGHMNWTKMPITHRGVQMPGYYDPKTKDFVYVDEMVPEIIVPDLTDCQLKPYVSYNVKQIETEVFDAKQLYQRTLQHEIVANYRKNNSVNKEN